MKIKFDNSIYVNLLAKIFMMRNTCIRIFPKLYFLRRNESYLRFKIETSFSAALVYRLLVKGHLEHHACQKEISLGLCIGQVLEKICHIGLIDTSAGHNCL